MPRSSHWGRNAGRTRPVCGRRRTTPAGHPVRCIRAEDHPTPHGGLDQLPFGQGHLRRWWYWDHERGAPLRETE